MTELVDNKVQKEIADKLNAITARALAIESLEETIPADEIHHPVFL